VYDILAPSHREVAGHRLVDERGRHRVSFLLRLWRAETKDVLEWRASLETLDGDRLAFASIDELCLYLRREAGLPPTPPPDHNDPLTERGDSK